MSAPISTLVSEIGAIRSLDDEAVLKKLQALVDSFFQHPEAGENLEVWFRLFERFPEGEGFGILWSVLHALERYPGCDALVVASVRRKPSEFPVRMTNRMINGGIKSVDGVDLIGLLETIARDETALAGIRESARSFLEYQQAKITRH